MEKSNKVTELKAAPTTNKSLQRLSPEVTVNQLFYANAHHGRGNVPGCKLNANYLWSPSGPCRAGRGFIEPELMWFREPGGRGETSAGTSPHPPQPAAIGEVATGGASCHWNYGAAGQANRGAAREQDEISCQVQSDEEDLEPPLPLRSDDEWQHFGPFLPHHSCMHNCEPHHNMNVRYYQSTRGRCDFSPPAYRHAPQPLCHHSAPPYQPAGPWDHPQNWLRRQDNPEDGGVTHGGGVSVNVPQFFVPPVEGMSKVSVQDPGSTGPGAAVSHPHEKQRSISLPDVCRKVFITYSSDISSEIIPFVDFLTKKGFRPAVDIIDNPIRRLDINKWVDSFLKDPLTLIIIAISPKYKADIEGSVSDGHGLHTRYIHAMIQNEFIQQGSLNFRFIPVCFLNTSQRNVPRWLQNTRVYQWPLDTEDLLLRLLREERYLPPPVPTELTLIIRPVASSAAATM